MKNYCSVIWIANEKALTKPNTETRMGSRYRVQHKHHAKASVFLNLSDSRSRRLATYVYNEWAFCVHHYYS